MTTSAELVTVVIPAYNQGRFVAQAVDSVLAQTYPHVETIVIDDGSTDDTAAVLGRFADRRGVTVVRQPNRGLPAARNRGLAEARGSFVCFLDSDDRLAPTYVERLIAPLVEDPELGFAYCDVRMMDEAGLPSGTFSVGESRRVLSGDIFESLLISGYFPPHTVLARTAAVRDAGGFDLELGGNADYELWLRLSALGHTAFYVDDRLAHYRVYTTSMSRDEEHMRASRTRALERIARRFPDRMAAGLSTVQDMAVDLHATNEWLRQQWQAMSQTRDAAGRWSLLQHLEDATLVDGAPRQLARWNVAIGNDLLSPAVHLHPPAAMEVTIPHGEAGRLSTAMAFHPDAWTKPDTGACIFAVTVDGAVTGSVLLDPVARVADRRWVSLALDVPASETGQHVLRVETLSPASNAYGWVMFKDVIFESIGAAA